MTRHVAIGPDGGNLLGFLASLGTLCALERGMSESEPRLSWSHDGFWRPVYDLEGEASEDDLCAGVAGALRDSVLPLFGTISDANEQPFPDTARLPVEDFRRLSNALAEERDATALIAALGAEPVDPSSSHIEDTALRTMSGAGHQRFLGFARQLLEAVTPENVRDALFRPWGYEDSKLSMRWDPVDDRRHALRARDPSAETIPSVRGANALAVAAIPLFPVFPRTPRATTRGFGRRRRRTHITWPIWTPGCRLDAVRALLSLPDLGRLDGEGVSIVEQARRGRSRRPGLEAYGIVQAFRARRKTVDKYRSFSPAVGLLG